MRLGIAGLMALGLVTLATTPARADDHDEHYEQREHRGPRIPLPHIRVQIAPPVTGGYVAPAPYAYPQPGYAQPAPYVGQPGYPYGGGPGYVAPNGGRWQDPGFFAARMNDRMNGIANDLRERVQSGVVSPQAISEFEDRRRDIQGDINAASRDGVITPDERDHIREDVDGMRFLEQRYRTGGYPGAYGGGPRGWGRGW